MGRWPEGPFVESRNDEFSKIEICDFWNLDFRKSKFAIFKFGFSKIGNFDFQKLNFSGAFVTAKISKTVWSLSDAFARKKMSVTDIHTHRQTDRQTHAHHQFWGSSTQKALRATRLHPHCSFWSNGNGWSRRITVDPGDNYRHSRKFVILTCRLQIDRPIFEPPKRFKMCQFVSIRYLK